MMRFFTVYGPWGRPDMAYFKFTKAITKNKYDLPMSHQSINRMPEWKKQVSQWSKELVNASQQFQNGNASVIPAKNACDYCEYDLLCRVDKADNSG